MRERVRERERERERKRRGVYVYVCMRKRSKIYNKMIIHTYISIVVLVYILLVSLIDP
jgi:hypothetical protein